MATIASIFKSVKDVAKPVMDIAGTAAQGEGAKVSAKSIAKTLANTDIRVLAAGVVVVATGVVLAKRIITPIKGYMHDENITITDLFDKTLDPVEYPNRMAKMHRHRILKKVKKSVFREKLAKSKKKHKKDKKIRNEWTNKKWMEEMRTNFIKECMNDPILCQAEFLEKYDKNGKKKKFGKIKVKPRHNQKIHEWDCGCFDRDEYVYPEDREDQMKRYGKGDDYRDSERLDRLYNQLKDLVNSREFQTLLRKNGITLGEEWMQF